MNNTNTDIPSLQHFLDHTEVNIKEWKTTLFDIAGFPHYENVMSNVYAYFLDPNENHGLGSLFIDALQVILSSSYDFDHVEIMREYTVTDQKRIDILIANTSEESKHQIKQAIIIENKMFHLLNNDLDKYYAFFDKLEKGNKRGVVLTLKPLTVSDHRYRNVTHQDWVDQIKSMIAGHAIQDIPPDTQHMLNQFFQNLTNHTTVSDMKEQFNLITKNHKKVKAIEEAKNQLDKHIWRQIEDVSAHLVDLNFEVEIRKGAGLAYCYSRDPSKASGVFFTFFPAIKWQDNPSISIVLELKNKGLEKKDEIDKLSFIEEEKEIKHTLDEQQLNQGYLHYASKVFPITDHEINNLSAYIAQCIRSSPLQTMYDQIIELLYNTEDTKSDVKFKM